MMDDEGILTPDSEWRHFINVEPPIFLAFIAYGMTDIVFPDLILFQACRTMSNTRENCDIIHTNSSSAAARDLDDLIQPEASYILMYQSLIEGTLAAFLSLFLGAWSDKYGRKPLLFIGYFAAACKSIILSILTLWDLKPWLFLFASIPSGILGGSSGIILGTICYISDITHSDNLAWRLAFLQAVYSTGLMIGAFIGPFIFQRFGYASLFAAAASVNVVSLLHILMFTRETIRSDTQHRWKYLLDVKLIKSLIVTTTNKRPGLNRFVLWSCVFILSLQVVLMEGHGEMGYLFVNAKLGWNTIQYSIYNSVSMIISIIGTILGLKLLKTYLGCSDIDAAVVGTLSTFSAEMILAFTTESWHMYMGISLGIFSTIVSPTIRSVLSKSIPEKDTGKVFSVVTFTEMLLPLAGSSLYSFIYSAYMPPVYPLPAYILSGGISCLIIILVVLVDNEITRYQTVFTLHDGQD